MMIKNILISALRATKTPHYRVIQSSVQSSYMAQYRCFTQNNKGGANAAIFTGPTPPEQKNKAA